MRIGDVDGKGRIYDKEGILIPEEGETVYSVFPSIKINLSGNWSFISFGNSIFDGDWGNGTVFITDRRIVFIRRPDVNLIKSHRVYGGDAELFFLDDDSSDYRAAIAHAKKVNLFQAFDFLEIRYEDIERIKRGPTHWRFCIKWRGKHASFTTKSRIAEKILPMMKEQDILKKKLPKE